MRLFPIDTEGYLLKKASAPHYGIPLFQWFVRGEHGWALLCWLQVLNVQTLDASYRGVIQWYREGDRWALELWWGRRGLHILSGFRVGRIRDEGLEMERREREEREGRDGR